MAATLHQVVNDSPVPPSEHNPGLHPGLDRVILQLLAKDPRGRLASALEVSSCLADLDGVEQGKRIRWWPMAVAACLLALGIAI